MSSVSINDPETDSRASESVGFYLVRFGTQRDIVPIHSGITSLSRGDEVVCRTHRGVEIGEVLAATEPEFVADTTAGKFIRRTRPDDQLLWKQLKLLSLEASIECQDFLKQQGSEDVLLEVEPLIDGRTLYFHFLGDPSIDTERAVQRLSDVYQKKVASSRFAKLLEHGCGPGCGTKEKSGCGTSGGCAVCAVAGGCTSKK
jgi:cell fate regulator YaaT (PSP1 superfamily)